jgi:membrane-associated phospholipid phosphatase
MIARVRDVRIVAAIALCAAAFPWFASGTAHAQSPRELRYELAPSLAVGGGLALGATLLLTLADNPAACRWCETGTPEPFYADEDHETYAFLSDAGLATSWIGGFGVAFEGGYFEGGRGQGGLEHGAENAWAVLEVVVATEIFTTAVKVLAARRRPETAFKPEVRDVAGNVSFFSGHAAQSAAVAASVSTVAFMRDYDWAPAAAAGFGAVAFATGLFRVLAGRHWPSDVVVGWVAGAAVGILMPLALHAPSGAASSN